MGGGDPNFNDVEVTGRGGGAGGGAARERDGGSCGRQSSNSDTCLW